MFKAIKLFCVGIVLGIANIIPGVSGGTLAVVFNVYDKILAVITPSVRRILAQWKFWLPLGAGVLAGIIFFTKLTVFLFERHNAPTSCFFLGLIAGSIPLVYRKTRYKPDQISAIPPLSALIAGAATFALMLFMFLTRQDGGYAEQAVNFQSSQMMFAVFLLGAGILAAVAMIIPGISGSFLLLALGVYTTIIGAANNLVDITFAFVRGKQSFSNAFSQAQSPLFIILPVLLGIIIGLFCGAALVRFLLKHIPRQTYGAILGLIVGSLFVVFPKTSAFTNMYVVIISIACFVAGAVITLIMDRQNLRQI